MLSFVLYLASAAQPLPPREQRDELEAYLASKNREFAVSESAAGSRGLSGNVTAIYNLLRDKGSMSRARVIAGPADKQSRVRDALTRTLAYNLASSGITPSMITAANRDGLDVLTSAAELMQGRGDIFDVIAISPILVSASVISIETPVAGSPNQVIQLSVDKTYFGNLSGDFKLEVFASSPLYQSAQVGDKHLLFLSQSLGGFRKAARLQGNTGELAQITTGYQIVGNQVQPIGAYRPPNSYTLAQIGSFVFENDVAFKARDAIVRRQPNGCGHVRWSRQKPRDRHQEIWEWRAEESLRRNLSIGSRPWGHGTDVCSQRCPNSD